MEEHHLLTKVWKTPAILLYQLRPKFSLTISRDRWFYRLATDYTALRLWPLRDCHEASPTGWSAKLEWIGNALMYLWSRFIRCPLGKHSWRLASVGRLSGSGGVDGLYKYKYCRKQDRFTGTIG